MAYSASLPNSYDSTLNAIKIRKRYFDEYLGLTPLTVFMGTSANDAIQVFESDSGEGLTYRVPFRKDLNYENPVIGFDQAAGAEQPVTIYEDEIKANLQRFVDMLMGVPITRKMTPVDVYEALRPLLMNAQRRNLVKSVLDLATTGLYNKAAGGDGPKTDRVVYAGAGGMGTYNASINTACDAQTAFNANEEYKGAGLSVAHLRKLKSMAVNGGHEFEKESRIKPVELKSKKGFPEELYIYLMDTDAYVSLSKDPAWKEFVYRGVIQGNDQPEGLSGARYRGMVEGIMVYECPELSRYRVDLSGDKKAAWNLLLGAQAFGLYWAQRPWFEMEQRDFNLNVAMAVCEIRGQKALMFPSFQKPSENIERGIIHSFTRIK